MNNREDAGGNAETQPPMSCDCEKLERRAKRDEVTRAIRRIKMPDTPERRLSWRCLFKPGEDSRTGETWTKARTDPHRFNAKYATSSFVVKPLKRDLRSHARHPARTFIVEGVNQGSARKVGPQRTLLRLLLP